MAYSSEIVRKARRRLEESRQMREAETSARLRQVYEALPRVRQIDSLLRRSMAMAAQSMFTQGAEDAFLQVRQANQALQQERQALIDGKFGSGFLDESPICARCGGTGYIGTAMCVCLKELCRQEQEKELSLLASEEQRFQNFRLDYYPIQPDAKYRVAPRELMKNNLQICKDYAENFPAGNLMFIGGTGLGKTFLSACIAREVAAKGYSVSYETAQSLFSKMEKNQFKPDEGSQQAVNVLLDCDLLILDDLGTELPGAFVTAALYHVVNSRILNHKSMVISTNLNITDINSRYSPQIASRLQGDFKRLTFLGQDIRVLKNRGI